MSGVCEWCLCCRSVDPGCQVGTGEEHVHGQCSQSPPEGAAVQSFIEEIVARGTCSAVFVMQALGAHDTGSWCP